MTKHKRPTPRDDARSEPKSNTSDVVSLITERRKLEEWIAALEAKKSQTPPQAFMRVHADYDARLHVVVEKLTAHTSSLGNEVAGLTKKLEKIDDEIEQRQDDRAEIELRSHVGELDTDELDEALRAADDGLAQLAASRNTIEADLVRVTEFFAAATGGPAPSSTPPRQSRASFDELRFLHSVIGDEGDRQKPTEPRPKPRFELEREDEKPSSAPPVRTGEIAARKVVEKPAEAPIERPAEKPTQKPVEKPIEAVAMQPVEEVVENAVEKAVEKAVEAAIGKAVARAVEKAVEKVVEKPVAKAVEAPVEKPAAERAPEPPAVVAAAPAIEKESDAHTPTLPQREARPSIVMQSMSQTIEPEAVEPPRNSIGILKTDGSAPSLLDGLLSKTRDSEKPFAGNVASNSPLSLKSAEKGDYKTLKCKECGSMNDPTEWYCERCGAELSAM